MSDTKTPLARLLNPSSVAVVGASASPEKPGYQMMKSLEPFPGTVYPVNPNAEQILGHKAFPDLGTIPEPVDLVALVVPPGASAAVLRQAAENGAGAALMVSGGFSETGEDGRALQDEIAGICREAGIRLLGPNTSGFINPNAGLYATFLPPICAIGPGSIGIVAQSGGINITAAFLAHADGLGLSLAAGLGNAADVGLVDVIDYLTDDPGTAAIAIHLEGVPDGRALFEAVRRATGAKPVVALPVGRADLGGFAESHTGNLMGSFALTRSALAQAGAVVVDTTADLVDAAHLLSRARLAPNPDPGIGILTGQAGPGLLMTDTLRSAATSVPEVSEDTVEKISTLLPPMTFIRNPVDTGRPLASFGAVLEALARDAAIDAILIYALLEADAVDPIEHIGGVAGKLPQPIIYSTCGTADDIRPIMEALESKGIASFDSPDRAARAVRALANDARNASRIGADRPVEEIPTKGVEPTAAAVDENAAKELIEGIGVPTPQRMVCASHDDAHAALAAIAAPVVVKVLDASITHKTEVGGVHLGIDTPEALATALKAIDAIPSSGAERRYLVEAMAPPGVEIIIGATNDPSFGPTVLVGLGGTAAEALGDVAMRLAPLGTTEAATMIDDLQGRALLDGWRGAPPADASAIADAVAKIGALMVANPDIRELDLNPVRVYADGLLALDALVVV